MKKKLWLLLALAGSILCAVFGLAACDKGNQTSLQKNVQELEIGYTTEQVRGILGDPDEEESDNWQYYGGEMKSLIKQGKELENKLLSVESEGDLEDILNQLVELEEKMSTAEYSYTRVNFDNKNKLKTVIFDVSVRGGESKYNKTVDTYELFPKVITLFSNPNSVKLSVKETYTDGSFYLGAPAISASEVNTFSNGYYNLSWSSYFSDKTVKDCSDSIVVSENIVAGTEISGTLGSHTFEVTIGKNCSVKDLKLDIVLVGNAPAVTYNESVDTYWENIRSYVTGIEIPDTVTSIGDEAFYGCLRLTGVNIPDGVTSIGKSAFGECRELASVVLPDSVENIGFGAFGGCSALTSFTVPENVKIFAGNVFRECRNLKTLFWNATACQRCGESNNYERALDRSSVTTLIIGDNVTSIPAFAFSRCQTLIDFTIPDSVREIEWGAFDDTGFYNDESKWQNGVLYIDNHLIEAKETLSGQYKIKDGTVTISVEAFYNCGKLTSITIPVSVTNISRNAFYDCSSLKNINYEGTKAQWNAIEKADGWNSKTGRYTIHCTDGDI